MYLDTGFVIAPVISKSLLIGSQDMEFLDDITPQLSTTPMYTDMSDQHFRETSILEQVINSYIVILKNYT